MSGHSKFANIKHKKEKNDAKKGKIFTIIGREIVMAVKAGGPDPNNNGKLRDAVSYTHLDVYKRQQGGEHFGCKRDLKGGN